MLRRAINLTTAMSLALFLACAAASVRARWTTDHLELNLRAGGSDTYRGWELQNCIRGFTLAWSFELDPDTRIPFRHFRTLRRNEDDYVYFGNDFRMPGLRHYDGNHQPGCGALFVAHWLVSAITLTPPLLVFVARLAQSRRRREGKCAACGYDLRATPDRCPECGQCPSGAGTSV